MSKKFIVEVVCSATVRFSKTIEAECEGDAKRKFGKYLKNGSTLAPVYAPRSEIVEWPVEGPDYSPEDFEAECQEPAEFTEDDIPF